VNVLRNLKCINKRFTSQCVVPGATEKFQILSSNLNPLRAGLPVLAFSFFFTFSKTKSVTWRFGFSVALGGFSRALGLQRTEQCPGLVGG
jgi:hypothetical protein